jgi:uncharacterized protein YodC (DUF2158 family)
MEPNFEVGDVVKLKSGGERMTVEGVEDGYVHCVWFDGRKPERGTFPAKALDKM